nr:Developmental and secondary metabolism regulator veA like [Ipomoea batatas]
MAYRRKLGLTRSATFHPDIRQHSSEDLDSPSETSPSLAAKAIRASAAHRESSLSSAYSPRSKGSPTYDYTSMKGSDDVGGFWGVLVRKAKAILEDETMSREIEAPSISPPKANQSFQQHDSSKKMENPTLRNGLDAFTSSLNNFGNALEEGRSIVENKTADIIQETRKLQIRRNGTGPSEQNQGSKTQPTQSQKQTSNEDQLTESRKMAVATAAKAKLLLRELKTLKSDLAYAKERCSQLEEENRMLRETGQKGDHHDDDDMIRLQLETLLAEKSRLANENEVYARENRFLREILEYHQLTMDFIDFDEDDIEEVTEVYPLPAVSTFPVPLPQQVTMDVPQTEVPPSHTVPEVEDSTKTC